MKDWPRRALGAGIFAAWGRLSVEKKGISGPVRWKKLWKIGSERHDKAGKQCMRGDIVSGPVGNNMLCYQDVAMILCEAGPLQGRDCSHDELSPEFTQMGGSGLR